jgi:hypothetical protein
MPQRGEAAINRSAPVLGRRNVGSLAVWEQSSPASLAAAGHLSKWTGRYRFCNVKPDVGKNSAQPLLMNWSDGMKNEAVLLPIAIVALTGVTLLLSARQQNEIATESVAAAPAVDQASPADAAVPPPDPATPAEPANTVRPAKLSYGLDEIAKMIEAGVDPEVVQTFIENSTIAYGPNAEDIVHLRELGAPSSVVAALIRHGGKLRERGLQESRAVQTQFSQPSTPAVHYTATSAAVAAPAPQPASVTYNTFNYSYPTVAHAAYPTWHYAAPPYVCYPRYSYAYPRYHFPRHYFATHYSSCRPFIGYGYHAPRFVRFGVGVGYGSYRFCRPAPRFHVGVRF